MSHTEPLFGFNTTQKKSLTEFLEQADAGDTVTASQISDSTATGRAVLTAANAAAALTAVGGLSPTGNGSGLTALNATQLTTGTVPVARLPNATTAARGVVLQATARADSAAADVAALNVIFNDLLAKLRTAGILAP